MLRLKIKKLHFCFLILIMLKLMLLFAYQKYIGTNYRLGDTHDYLAGVYLFRQDWTSTAYIMSLTGAFFTNSLGYWFANVPLLLLSWLGALKLASHIDTRNNFVWLLLALVLLSPSNIIWTSFHTKEAIVSSFFCIFLYYYIESDKSRLKLTSLVLYYLSGSIVLFFKPHFGPAIVWLLAAKPLLFNNGSRFAKILSIVAILLALAASIVVFYIYFSEIEIVVQNFHKHFSTSGELTRDYRWDGVLNLIYDAPLGVLLGFTGPTLFESYGNPILVVVFIEGYFYFLLAFVILLGILGSNGERSRYYFLLGLVFFILLLLANYPVGYFNSGSAVRYRQLFFLPLMLFLMYLYSTRSKQ